MPGLLQCIKLLAVIHPLDGDELARIGLANCNSLEIFESELVDPMNLLPRDSCFVSTYSNVPTPAWTAFES